MEEVNSGLQCCSMLLCVAVRVCCGVLQHNESSSPHSLVLQCAAVCCSVLQHAALRSSVFQRAAAAQSLIAPAHSHTKKSVKIPQIFHGHSIFQSVRIPKAFHGRS
mmetsp:Transcript_59512/g.96290  ORF Transcript_59512/g.96290 Transcript_59512/m.96290 type:complete len:106 (+) Transcript_59512:45-362(+)